MDVISEVLEVLFIYIWFKFYLEVLLDVTFGL